MDRFAQYRYDEDATVSQAQLYDGDVALDEQREFLSVLMGQFRDRGIVRAAAVQEQELEIRQQEAKTIAPNSYRLEELSQDGRGDRFRHGSYLGRQMMDVEDFMAYFAACRSRRPLHCYDVEGAVPVREVEASAVYRTREESRRARRAERAAILAERKKNSKMMQVATTVGAWLQPDDPSLRVAGKRRRVPAALISTFVVIATSLMLIVSGTVMVAQARREVGTLQDDVQLLATEAELLEDKVEASIDYLSIYRTATEEYGMLDADYIRTLYVQQSDAPQIETYEPKEDVTFGLSTLLSAFGLR